MAWFSSAVGFVHKKLQQLRGQESVDIYPSEALIDQMVPPELMEQIFINLDCSTLVTCILVSKYWRLYATNEQIYEHAVDTFYQRGIDELKIILARQVPSFDLKLIRWRRYQANYPRKLVLADRVLAAKAGKFLLELDSVQNARTINYALAPQRHNPPNADIRKSNATVLRFWVKSKGKFHYDPDSDELKVTSSGFTQVTLQSHSLRGGQRMCYSLAGKECDVIMEFSEVPNLYVDLKGGVVKIRVLAKTPYLLQSP